MVGRVASEERDCDGEEHQPDGRADVPVSQVRGVHAQEADHRGQRDRHRPGDPSAQAHEERERHDGREVERPEEGLLQRAERAERGRDDEGQPRPEDRAVHRIVPPQEGPAVAREIVHRAEHEEGGAPPREGVHDVRPIGVEHEVEGPPEEPEEEGDQHQRTGDPHRLALRVLGHALFFAGGRALVQDHVVDELAQRADPDERHDRRFHRPLPRASRVCFPGCRPRPTADPSAPPRAPGAGGAHGCAPASPRRSP